MAARSRRAAALLGLLLFTFSCSKGPAPPASSGAQVLRIGNGGEPEDIDPHLTTGIPEFRIEEALIEGLVTPDPRSLEPLPGVASSWNISADGLTYTFHLRADALWSDGTPVTSQDFLQSWQRLLSPALGAEFAYLVFDYVKGAREYHDGKTTDFSSVGFRAPNARTVVVTLVNPTPFLLRIIADHQAWDPVPLKTLLKYGGVADRHTAWTRPGNFVGNGPFALKEWAPHQRLTVTRSPTYWDRANVRLDEIDFMPVEDEGGEERMFRTGELDKTLGVPTSKIAAYRAEHPESLHLDPYVGIYFYRCNVTVPPLNDRRVRRALAIALDREQIVRDVTRGGQTPAYAFSYPGDAGYTPTARISGTLEEARRLLAEAGYPGGRGMPPIRFLYNTSDGHKEIAEAIQEMWRQKLGVELVLTNEEWKVYLESVRAGRYQMARAGWVASYEDPSIFLDIMTTGNGNNNTGWSSPEYDRLQAASLHTGNDADRFGIYQRMDAILVDECPVIPIYYYTRPYLLSPRVKGFWPNVLDNHPYKYIYLQD
jgi:oligopeptide transport system substrate-binding protein